MLALNYSKKNVFSHCLCELVHILSLTKIYSKNYGMEYYKIGNQVKRYTPFCKQDLKQNHCQEFIVGQPCATELSKRSCNIQFKHTVPYIMLSCQ